MVENIFFTINKAESCKAIVKHIKAYNKQLGVDSPQTAKKECVKANVLHTANKLVELAYMHFKSGDDYAVIPDSFKTSNTYLAACTGFNKATVYRHIKILQKCGVISEKVFRGSNAKYEVYFNAHLIVLNNVCHFQKLVVEMYKDAKKQAEICEKTESTLKSILPLFSMFPNCCMIASCNHILKEHLININIIEGVAVKNSDSFSNLEANTEARAKTVPVIPSSSAQEQIEAHDIISRGAAENFVNNVVDSLPMQQISAINKEITEKNRLLASYVRRAYIFAISLLWRNTSLAPSQIKSLKYYIGAIFYDAIDNNSGELVLAKLENEFYTRIYLTKEYVNRSPERFVPIPSKYFDKEFAHGFWATAEWYKAHQARKKANKEWNSNARLVAALYKNYSKTGSSADFSNALQTLQKKKDDKFLMMFCELVEDSTKFNHHFFNSQAQEFSQQSIN